MIKAWRYELFRMNNDFAIPSCSIALNRNNGAATMECLVLDYRNKTINVKSSFGECI